MKALSILVVLVASLYLTTGAPADLKQSQDGFPGLQDVSNIIEKLQDIIVVGQRQKRGAMSAEEAAKLAAQIKRKVDNLIKGNNKTRSRRSVDVDVPSLQIRMNDIMRKIKEAAELAEGARQRRDVAFPEAANKIKEVMRKVQDIQMNNQN